jgi:hypothetical protein
MTWRLIFVYFLKTFIVTVSHPFFSLAEAYCTLGFIFAQFSKGHKIIQRKNGK